MKYMYFEIAKLKNVSRKIHELLFVLTVIE